jgi:hypothetical protein
MFCGNADEHHSYPTNLSGRELLRKVCDAPITLLSLDFYLYGTYQAEPDVSKKIGHQLLRLRDLPKSWNFSCFAAHVYEQSLF